MADTEKRRRPAPPFWLRILCSIVWGFIGFVLGSFGGCISGQHVVQGDVLDGILLGSGILGAIPGAAIGFFVIAGVMMKRPTDGP